jgi:hypothetical protein
MRTIFEQEQPWERKTLQIEPGPTQASDAAKAVREAVKQASKGRIAKIIITIQYL